MTNEQIKKIGREYGTTGATKLAEELGVSKQRVEQIANKLRKLGVPIPKKRIRQEEIESIAEELKAEWQAKNL